MITASAPGKCILLGEHAVVYGHPAIAIAINIRSSCTIENNAEDFFNFQIPEHGIDLKLMGLKDFEQKVPKMYAQFYELLRVISKSYNISYEKLTFRVKSDLWNGSGLGSSASTSIAFIYALNERYTMGLSIEEINEYAFRMEKIVHKNPSGIDNNICSHGGAIVFQRGIRETLAIPKFPILITYSGESHNTGQIVSLLRKKQNKLTKQFHAIEKLVENGIVALKNHDYVNLGNLFNSNQEILSDLGLSTTHIDEIISISKDNGAYGSKLTGAGVGGSVITLGEIGDLHEIRFLHQQRGYLSEICYLDTNGGRIDSK